MDTLNQLKKERDLLSDKIARIEKRIALQKTQPIRKIIRARKEKLKQRGAWPLFVVIDWQDSNTWLHAHEHYFNFDLCELFYRRSSSGWGDWSGYFSLDGVYKQTRYEYDDAYYWRNYFEAKDSNLPSAKKYIRYFAPNQMLGQRYLWGGITGRAVFASQAIACPLCGDVSRQFNTSKELQKDRWCPYVSANTYDEVSADDGQLRSMLVAADLFLQGKFYENGLVFRRCEMCSGKSFKDYWRELHGKFQRQLDKANLERKESSGKYKPWQTPEIALKGINSIWPHLTIREQSQTSIFRQAKKRARIKPLNRRELAFFSMHLAATQMKELKALLNK